MPQNDSSCSSPACTRASHAHRSPCLDAPAYTACMLPRVVTERQPGLHRCAGHACGPSPDGEGLSLQATALAQEQPPRWSGAEAVGIALVWPQAAAPRRTPLRVQNLRVNNVEIPNNKRIEISLQYIYGIGQTTAKAILRDTVRAGQRLQWQGRNAAAALAGDMVGADSHTAQALQLADVHAWAYLHGRTGCGEQARLRAERGGDQQAA